MIRWIYRTYPPEKILGLHYKRFPMAPHCFDSHFCDKNRENIDFTSPVEKEGLELEMGALRVNIIARP